MHGECYRRANGQPYTRKEYIKGKPQSKIAKFEAGQKGNYDFCVELLINKRVQITHMAIESAYFSKLRIFPHILLRENKMIAAAGADRLQEGMRRAFGKAVSLAARVVQGQCIMEMHVKKEHVDAARKALKGACVKLPGTPTIRVTPLK